MEFLEAKAIAERLGFQLFADVRGDTNALRLFTEDFRQKYGKKYRCGVYMQFRADGSCYIGQSLDVDRRHKRHRELGVIVDYLAFRCWPPSVLMEKEDLCIQDALALGVPLVNKTLKCGTLKKSDDYDQILTPDEQDLFIERIAARQKLNQTVAVHVHALVCRREQRILRRLLVFFKCHGVKHGT